MRNSEQTRRCFLGVLGGSALTSYLAACASTPSLLSSATTMGTRGPVQWDDSWGERLGPHRVAFDVYDLETPPGAGQIPPVMDAYHEVLGVNDTELGFVLVARHMAVAMLMSDAMWAKYDMSPDFKRIDATTKAPYKRNPYSQLLTMLRNRGVTILGCHAALVGLTAMLAKRANADAASAREEILANLVPGVILQPNGIYALARAQERGCGFIR